MKRQLLSMMRLRRKKRHLHYGRRRPQGSHHQEEEEEERRLWKVRMRMRRMKTRTRMMSRFGNSRGKFHHFVDMGVVGCTRNSWLSNSGI